MNRLILILGLALPSLCLAQNYSIDWYRIAGGGGSSTGAVYSISGTIGQAEAGGEMKSSAYSLTGGFWALFAVQTPGAPRLTITFSGNQAILSWPPAVTGWTLQTNATLNSGAWGNYNGPVVNNAVTNTATPARLFFRLTRS